MKCNRLVIIGMIYGVVRRTGKSCSSRRKIIFWDTRQFVLSPLYHTDANCSMYKIRFFLHQHEPFAPKYATHQSLILLTQLLTVKPRQAKNSPTAEIRSMLSVD
jgi:hypothetical protein